MKKKTFIITIILIIVPIIIYISSFILTWQQMNISKKFFSYIRGSNYSLAYDLTAVQFQESIDLEAFLQYSNSLKLKETVAFSSMLRVPGLNLTKIYGKLIYADYEIPLTIYLAKFDDEWKILTLKVKPSREQFKPNEPSDEEVSLILQESLSDLIYGVKSGNFTDLYSSLAIKLKEQDS